ncbi:hypothetical protein H8356DRAFT_1315238 [Neocallimastix lanati (nom. inval.)]|nr:hypothetical protein H8356DRAFT_1315238 [Neocallimastix sp. JGI-2020a]
MDLEEDNLLILDSIIKDDEEYINKFVDNSVINEIKFSEVKASTNENISSPKITTIDLSKEENLDDIKNFVKALNDIIIQKDEFHLIEKVLLHPSFQPILNEFREKENKYKPLKDIVTINEDRIESYGHESIMKPETGVTRTILTQAITLEIILVLLNTVQRFF